MNFSVNIYMNLFQLVDTRNEREISEEGFPLLKYEEIVYHIEIGNWRFNHHMKVKSFIVLNKLTICIRVSKGRDKKKSLSRCPFVPGQGQEQMSWDKTLCPGTSRDKIN